MLEVAAGHLAAALLSEPEGLAAKAIAAAGVTPEQVYAALGTGAAPRVETPDSAGLLELSFDQSAVRDVGLWWYRLSSICKPTKAMV